MKLLRLEKGRKKKWVAVFRNQDGKYKRVGFGQVGANDYTLDASEKDRDNYRKRHQRDLKVGNPLMAGYLSFWILWGDSPDIEKNFYAYKEKFNL
jgi:hypothetical protein